MMQAACEKIQCDIYNMLMLEQMCVHVCLLVGFELGSPGCRGNQVISLVTGVELN